MTTTVLAYFPSPSQGVWYIGPFPLRAYALFIIIGIVVALLVGDRRWEARGGERGVIYDIALWAVPFGLIGGRLYHVITDWDKYFGSGDAGVVGALRIWDGGLGIWGAVALGGVGAWIGCRRRGIPLPAFGDAIAPGIVLAQAIGRLGNYFNQELYGRPTTLPWGMEIYLRENADGVVSPDLANGVSTGQLAGVVHPTFLYELLWNVLIFLVLIWVDRRFKIGHGRLFALYVAGYCLGRFWVELLRADEAWDPAGIRINSFTSTFVFIGAVVYIMVAPKGREDPSTLKGTAAREDSSIDEVAEELVAAAATTGVVAAAKAAGADEDEDIGTGEGSTADSDEPTDEDEADIEAEAAAEAEVLAKAVAEASSGDVDEAEELGADVAGVPADSVQGAEEFAAEGEAEPAPEAEEEAVGGVGAVEGEEVVEVEKSAPQVHQAAVEGAEEAEAVAAELETEEPSSDSEIEDGETEDAEQAVAEEADASEEAAEEAEAVVEEAEASEQAEQEPEEISAQPDPAAESRDEPGGRVRRWLRGRRNS